MTTIKPPETIEEFESIKKTIMEMLSNPYCDQSMFLNLSSKLEEVNENLERLNKIKDERDMASMRIGEGI